MKHFLLSSSLLSSFFLFSQSPVTSAMFGTMEARNLGPGTMSGRITAIEGVLKDEGKTLYVGSAGGGVWKSTNAGASYTSIFDKYCQSIGAIAIDPSNPSVLYVGTGESNMRNTVSIGNGMYKSNDAGDNWKFIGLDSTEHIARIIVNPTNTEEIFVAVPGPLWSDSRHRGLYKSINGGSTWEKILYVNEKTGCSEIVMDPMNPKILYASMWQFRRQPFSFDSGGKGSGFYKSTDGGKTWQELSKGLPEKPFGRIAMTIAPSDPTKMWAIVESSKTGLYISEDAGETWKSQSASLNVTARPFYFSTIVVDPKDAQRVYRPAFSFAYSNDAGYSFTEASADGGWVHSDMHALWINPINTNIMYVGTDGGVYMSVDKGITWQFNHALPVGQFYHVAHDNKEPYNVYGGLQDNGSWMAPSAAPGGVNNAHWSNVGGGDGFWTIPDPDGKVVYSEYQGGNMSRVNIVTRKSESIQPQKTSKEDKLRWNWNTPIVLGRKNPKNLYVGAQYLYKSTDQGRNWERISHDLTTNDQGKQQQEESGGLSADNTSAENHCTIYTVAESPLDENLIWVGTDDGNLQYTTDGGKNWHNVSPNVAKCGIASQSWVSCIAPSQFDKNTAYATFENHMYGDHQTYLAKTTDLGKTWVRLQSKEFNSFANVIVEDPVNQDLLFLGTEMGLYGTLDGGTNWFRMKNKIPDFALVRDLKIHPNTHDLIVATHGRGIFILDDIRSIRNLTREIWEQEVYLFPTPEITLKRGDFGGGGPEVSGGWSTWNPDTQPSINYYLKNRLASGKVTVEIYDTSGNLLQSIPGGIRKGINRMSWNLQGNPPKVASGGTKLDVAGFYAPMILPGTYPIKLTIKDSVYESFLTCVHDSKNEDFSETDRKMVYDHAIKIQQLYIQVNDLIDSLTRLQHQLIKDPLLFKKEKKYQTLHTDLENIRSKLMGTKSTSIFADEERLREKISALYAIYCGMESRPNTTQLEAINDLNTEFELQKNTFLKTIQKDKKWIGTLP
jgi:photosystem II stability/assembly factor-like uncharacterized protein